MALLHKIIKARKINWISSKDGDPETLSRLDERMRDFYSTSTGREDYQKLLDYENGEKIEETSIGYELLKYISGIISQDGQVLEVGCGRGNILRELQSIRQFSGYYGIDVAPYIINMNKEEFSNINWDVGTAYHIPYSDGKFDICYSHYVLEHLIYIEAALKEMMRVLKPDGKLILIFPDFVELKVMCSQFIGLSPIPTAKEKLKRGRILDSIISLYDSRIRIPNRLNHIHDYGAFPINVNPICLSYPEYSRPDLDALYISSKNEIANWAKLNHYTVSFPYGSKGRYRTQAFMVISR